MSGAGVGAAWSRPVLSGAGAGADPIGDLGPGAGALAVQKSGGSATLLSSIGTVPYVCTLYSVQYSGWYWFL